jgi:peptidoglycan/xylan/chitin deacetylase (PgdA/CDA1 family)
LTTLDAAGITSEMTQLEDALLSIIGKFPQYMRPPYFAYNSAVLSTLGSLGYHVIIADIDTLDYQGDYNAAANNFINGIANGGTISLSHDPLQQTVQVLAQEMITAVKNAGKQG